MASTCVRETRQVSPPDVSPCHPLAMADPRPSSPRDARLRVMALCQALRGSLGRHPGRRSARASQPIRLTSDVIRGQDAGLEGPGRCLHRGCRSPGPHMPQVRSAPPRCRHQGKRSFARRGRSATGRWIGARCTAFACSLEADLLLRHAPGESLAATEVTPADAHPQSIGTVRRVERAARCPTRVHRTVPPRVAASQRSRTCLQGLTTERPARFEPRHEVAALDERDEPAIPGVAHRVRASSEATHERLSDETAPSGSPSDVTARRSKFGASMRHALHPSTRLLHR